MRRIIINVPENTLAIVVTATARDEKTGTLYMISGTMDSGDIIAGKDLNISGMSDEAEATHD